MKAKYFVPALFVAVLQTLAFFPVLVLISTFINLYEWKTCNFWKVLKFNTSAAAHTITCNFREWRKM